MGGGASKPRKEAGQKPIEKKADQVSPFADLGDDPGISGDLGNAMSLDLLAGGGEEAVANNGKVVSSGKLKKLALGQSTYGDQQRDYDATLANVEFNKSKYLDWESASKTPSEAKATTNTPSRPQPATPKTPAKVATPIGGRGGGRLGVGPRPPPPRTPVVGAGTPMKTPAKAANGQFNVVMAPSELPTLTPAIDITPPKYAEKVNRPNLVVDTHIAQLDVRASVDSQSVTDDNYVLHGPSVMKDNKNADNDIDSDHSEDDVGEDGVYDWFAYNTAQSMEVADDKPASQPPALKTIVEDKAADKATAAKKQQPVAMPKTMGDDDKDADIIYATFADANQPLTPTRKHENIPSLNMANLQSPPISTPVRTVDKFTTPAKPRPPLRPGSTPNEMRTSNNGNNIMATSASKAMQTNAAMNTAMRTNGGASPATPAMGGRTQVRPTPPPKPTANSPHAVKETKDVKRNIAQMPSQLNHAKPTTGNWLNKRYIVNNFILLDTLGTGSYGEVRMCKDRTTDQLFAIKIISKDMLKKRKSANTSETYMEDIKREIAIMKKLLHPNVLRLYEVLDDPNVNKLYLVLEYMKKGDLINFLKEKEHDVSTSQDDNARRLSNANITPLSDLELWNIFRQVASGVRYLHYQNIIHGDIKPQNLLVGEDGIVKIADFGISKMLHASGQKLADAAGTPAFMSPELCAGEAFSGQLADVWALGATMFMLRFGHPPFVAKSIINLYNKIQNEPLVFPYPIDPGLQDLLDKMLTKDPNKRFTLQQVMMHQWLRHPPSNQNYQSMSAVSVSSSGQTSIATDSTTAGTRRNDANNSTDTANTNNNNNNNNNINNNNINNNINNNNRFQPPPSYAKEEKDAMDGPVNMVNNDELFRSISVGVHKAAAPVESEGKGNDDDNMMATNWGDDVFEIVNDVDEIASDSEDEDNATALKANPKTSNNNANYNNNSNSNAKDSKDNKDNKDIIEETPSAKISREMSADEEERRSKRFQGQLTKKSMQNVSKMSNSDPLIVSSDKALQIDPKSPQRVSSGQGVRTPSSVKSNKVLASSIDQDEMADALSMEDFENMMDTLAMQPKKSHNTVDFEDSEPLDTEPIVMQNASVQWKNVKSGLGAACFSERGRRESQEDRCLLLVDLLSESVQSAMTNKASTIAETTLELMARFSIACVFDGHSGHRASQFLHDELAKSLACHDKFFTKNIDEAIADVCRSLDEKLCAYLREDEDHCGSTALITVYDGRRHVLTIANVGDSVCVLSRGGRAVIPHKIHRLNDDAEKQRVEKTGAHVINCRVNGLLAVSRAFGDIQFKDFMESNYNNNNKSGSAVVSLQSPVISVPDIVSEVITPMTEFAILASDGLWDVMKPQVVVNFVRKKIHSQVSNKKPCDLQEIANELTQEALNRGSIDNVSIIILSFHMS